MTSSRLAWEDRNGEALAEADAIKALADAPEIAALVEGDIPATDVLLLAETIVRARVDQARGDYDAAADKFSAAIAIQAEIPYTEPPYWYYPVEQSLGAVLLQAGKNEDSVEAFRNSLIKHPNNARSLYGLMKAQEAAGDVVRSPLRGGRWAMLPWRRMRLR